MNYLAHLYLSIEDKEEMFGNFIGDFVKGRDYTKYPIKIQKGVKLHRFIDDFTDNHEITKEMSRKLKPFAGRFSMVVTDIYHDHFLAKFWENKNNITLHQFAQEFYNHPFWQQEWLPDRAANMYPYLKAFDWLNAYKTYDGLEKVFTGMERRIKNLAPLSKSVDWLKNDYDFFLDCHTNFFPELIQAVQQYKQNDIYKG